MHHVYTMRNSYPLMSLLTLTLSRLFLILLDPKSFQTALDYFTWLLGHVLFLRCRLIIILSIYVQLTLTLAKVCLHSRLITVIYHVLNNVKDVKKICFPTWKYIYYSCTLEKIHQPSFSENFVHSSKPLEFIDSDLIELPTLSYSKYKQVITFLDDHFFYYNITFLHKKSKAIEAIKSIFQILLPILWKCYILIIEENI